MLTRRTFGHGLAASLAAALAAAPAQAQSVKWDVSIPWGPSEFHTVNAQRFAEEVKTATNGAVELTIHPGGSLGVKANESLRAVADGSVPMAEYAAFQNVGELPILGIESIPFLVADYGQLKVMHSLVRGLWEEELLKRDQKALYLVPWPSQNFFTKKPVASIGDLKGVKMRTYDRVTAEMVSRLGMVPQQMGNPDIVPALAAGRIDAVMTSGTTAVAQKYWEFLKHAYTTNHLWATNLMVVNLDAWKKLTPEQRKAIEDTAKRLEPSFWEVSVGEHAKRMDELKSHGMTVEVANPQLVGAMREATKDMADAFARANPAAAPILAEYRKRTGGV